MTGTPKRTRRRWIWPVVAALGLSAVVQVGIVLMPDSWYTALHGGPATAEPRQLVLDENDVVWAVDRTDLRLFGEDIYAVATHLISHRGEAESQDKAILRAPIVPEWSMFAEASGSETLATTIQSLDADWHTCMLIEWAEGWPWRCVRGDMRTVMTPAPQRKDVMTFYGVVRLPGEVWIPYLPIWPGLVLNLVVLALPWYAVFWVARSGRRVYRRRRGRCSACNYDLAGLDRGTACPECGTVDSAA